MLGLYRVMEKITSDFPEVLFESCSGGGGRFDAGMLYYMPQTWTSDDTDAVERLCLQYGTSYVYPASAMGAHVSAAPNHQTGRVTGMRMRGEVAMGGNFGFELDLSKLSAEDIEIARQLVCEVKQAREITGKGVFTRLISPFEGNHAAWQFVSPEGDQALLCVYQVLCRPNTPPFRVRMKGLDLRGDLRRRGRQPLHRRRFDEHGPVDGAEGRLHQPGGAPETGELTPRRLKYGQKHGIIGNQ